MTGGFLFFLVFAVVSQIPELLKLFMELLPDLLGEHHPGGHGPYDAQRREEKHGLLLPSGGQHHGGEAQHGGNDVQRRHRLFLCPEHL